MGRFLVFAYGAVAYAVFLAAFLYAVGFTGSFAVPKGIDSDPAEATGVALAVDALLMGLFAVQHSVMARPGFKRWWTRIVPRSMERSTFVLLSSLLLGLLFWQWRPLGDTVWRVEAAGGRAALWALFALGWGLVLVSTFLIDHFDLFGLRQVWLHLRGKEYVPLPFQRRGLYRVVRHPIMLGFVVAFWATPSMSVGHLVFAVVTTGYILVGVALEEHDLLRFHGEDYAKYRREVPMLLPVPRRGEAADPSPGGATP